MSRQTATPSKSFSYIREHSHMYQQVSWFSPVVHWYQYLEPFIPLRFLNFPSCSSWRNRDSNQFCNSIWKAYFVSGSLNFMTSNFRLVFTNSFLAASLIFSSPFYMYILQWSSPSLTNKIMIDLVFSLGMCRSLYEPSYGEREFHQYLDHSMSTNSSCYWWFVLILRK